jgi:hypothetical protein
MPPGQYTSFPPLGQLTIATPGTTVLLSANIGPQGGQVAGANYLAPPVPGIAWRFMEIQADPGNPGNIFLLPRGKTAAGNPGSILAKIGPGGSAPFPTGLLANSGFVPENFCLDCDTAGSNLAYGYGSLG